MATVLLRRDVGGFIAAVVIYLTRWIVTRWRRDRFMRSHRCKPIPNHPASVGLWQDFDQRRQKATEDGRVNEFCLEQYQICGTSTFWLSTLNEQMIWTTEPANHQVIANRVDDWLKEDRFAMRPFHGPSLLTENGSMWKKRREIITPLFDHTGSTNLHHFKKFVDRMLPLLPRVGETVDMQAMLRRLSLDNSTEYIFGESVGSLTGESNAENFIDRFNRASAQAMDRFMTTGFRSLFHRFGVWNSQWLADTAVVHGFVDGCIERYRNSLRTETKPECPDPSRRYVLMEAMSEKISDPIALRYELLGIFSIALETSAIAFSNILFVLARHPDTWTELRQQALLMDEKQTTDPIHLKSLASFRHTIFECFRLHSPVTRTRALSARDTVLPRGGGSDGSAPAFVPKGSIVITDRYPNSLDAAVWGDDARDFRPARFEGKSLGSEFLPFSVGPRVCPANKQILLHCTYLLVRLTREFEMIENRDPCAEYIEGVFTCFYSRNGCQIALHRSEE